MATKRSRGERWSDVTTVNADLRARFSGLTSRELVIVGAGLLDTGLVELIRKRLSFRQEAADALLGLNNEPFAPGASFAARIQLAYVLGIIDDNQADSLRQLKVIRNAMAHRVQVTLLSPEVFKAVRQLYDLQMQSIGVIFKPGEYVLESAEESARNVILSVVALTHLVFHRILERLEPLGRAWPLPPLGDEK